MIVEIKDMPMQKIKSIDIHIVFDENDNCKSNITCNDIVLNTNDDTKRSSNSSDDKICDIPQEMLDGEF